MCTGCIQDGVLLSQQCSSSQLLLFEATVSRTRCSPNANSKRYLLIGNPYLLPSGMANPGVMEGWFLCNTGPFSSLSLISNSSTGLLTSENNMIVVQNSGFAWS